MNIQLVRTHALYALGQYALSPYDREHVLSAYDKPERAVSYLPATDEVQWPDGFRCTLDTPADYAWFQRIAAEIDVTPPLHPTPQELLALLQRRPDLIRTEEDYAREQAAAPDLRQ